MTEEWLNEPDRKDWFAFGLHCLVKRAGGIEDSLGHLCGYVDLPAAHPMFGKDYDDIPVDVHGGLTFAQPNGADWRVGFDCAHSGDLIPGMLQWQRERVFRETYRNFAWVEQETNRLASQLAKMRPTEGDDE